MPNDTPSNKTKFTPVVAVKDALKSAVDSRLHSAVIRSGSDGSFKIDGSLAGSAREAAKTAVINEAARALCGQGYAMTLTCESSAPGKATYYFDFSTDKGKERVEVGVAMDNDRAAYLLKKVSGGMSNFLGGVSSFLQGD